MSCEHVLVYQSSEWDNNFEREIGTHDYNDTVYIPC